MAVSMVSPRLQSRNRATRNLLNLNNKNYAERMSGASAMRPRTIPAGYGGPSSGAARHLLPAREEKERPTQFYKMRIYPFSPYHGEKVARSAG